MVIREEKLKGIVGAKSGFGFPLIQMSDSHYREHIDLELGS